MLVTDQALRLGLQRPLPQDTKIVDERLPTPSLIRAADGCCFGRGAAQDCLRPGGESGLVVRRLSRSRRAASRDYRGVAPPGRVPAAILETCAETALALQPRLGLRS